LNDRIENPLSPVMWIGMNPSYRLDNEMDVTHFRETFKGEKE